MLSINEQSQVKAWLEAERNGERFPVDFDIAWVMAGYAMKHHAKRRLTNQTSYLVKDEDYTIDKESVPITQSGESTILGRSSDRIVMTCDAFKHFCLMTQTAKGREIRQYFIEAEKALNHAIPTCQLMAQEIDRLHGRIVELEDDRAGYNPNYIKDKFSVHSMPPAPGQTTEVYNVVCRLQNGYFFNLMTYVLPADIAQEKDFDVYCMRKRQVMAPLDAFVKMLNAMSQDFIPCSELTAQRYAQL